MWIKWNEVKPLIKIGNTFPVFEILQRRMTCQSSPGSEREVVPQRPGARTELLTYPLPGGHALSWWVCEFVLLQKVLICLVP